MLPSSAASVSQDQASKPRARKARRITPERSQVVDFTQSYFAGGLSALVKADSPIKTLADLNGKKVTVQVGTKSVNFLRDNYPQVKPASEG